LQFHNVCPVVWNVVWSVVGVTGGVTGKVCEESRGG